MNRTDFFNQIKKLYPDISDDHINGMVAIAMHEVDRKGNNIKPIKEVTYKSKAAIKKYVDQYPEKHKYKVDSNGKKLKRTDPGWDKGKWEYPDPPPNFVRTLKALNGGTVEDNEKSIMNELYKFSAGNKGNEAGFENDGSMFIGRGFVQLTGRGNYEKLNKYFKEKGITDSNGNPIDLLTNPDLLVTDPDVSIHALVAYMDTTTRSASNDGKNYFEWDFENDNITAADLYRIPNPGAADSIAMPEIITNYFPDLKVAENLPQDRLDEMPPSYVIENWKPGDDIPQGYEQQGNALVEIPSDRLEGEQEGNQGGETKKQTKAGSAYSQGLTAEDFKKDFPKHSDHFSLNIKGGDGVTTQTQSFDNFVNGLINQKDGEGNYVHDAESIKNNIKVYIDRSNNLQDPDKRNKYVSGLIEGYNSKIATIDEQLKDETLSEARKEYLTKQKNELNSAIEKLSQKPVLATEEDEAPQTGPVPPIEEIDPNKLPDPIKTEEGFEDRPDPDAPKVYETPSLTIAEIMAIEDGLNVIETEGEQQVTEVEDDQNWEESASGIINKLNSYKKDYEALIKKGYDNLNDDEKARFDSMQGLFNSSYSELVDLYNKHDRQMPGEIKSWEEWAASLGDHSITLDSSVDATNDNANNADGDPANGYIATTKKKIADFDIAIQNATTKEEIEQLQNQKNALQTELDGVLNPQNEGQEMDPETKTLTTDEKNFMDKIGGPGTLVSLGMLGLTTPALLKDIDVKEYPELSSAMDEHIKQARELANQGFSASEEAQIRNDIDTAYKAGITNLVRGTAGDRARFLAGSGMVDANRAKALLDFAAKDAELQRQNSKQYGELLQFKENYNFEKDSKRRDEELQMQLANKGSAATLASEAVSSIVQNIQDEKMYGKGSLYESAMKAKITEMGFELPGSKNDKSNRKLEKNVKKAANYYNVNIDQIDPTTFTPYVKQDTTSKTTTPTGSKSGTYTEPFIDPSEVGTNTYIDEFGQETEVSVSPFAGTVTPESITAPFRSKFKRLRK